MNTGEREALAVEIVEEMEDVTKLRRRHSDTFRTYQWAIGILVAVILSGSGTIAGMLLKDNKVNKVSSDMIIQQGINEKQDALIEQFTKRNDSDHTEIKQSLRDIQGMLNILNARTARTIR